MKWFQVLLLSSPIGLMLLSSTGTASAQLISVSPQTLSFTYQVGGQSPASQNLSLTASSPTQFSVTISGAPWLAVSPSSGLTPSTLNASLVNPASLTPGTYTGSIIIGPPASTDAIKTVVSVTLTVTPAPGTLQVSPSSISFDYGQGGPAPAASVLSITSSGPPLGFTISQPASWLSVSPTSTVTPATAYVNVVPNNGLPPGVYSTVITVSQTNSAGSQQQVYVTLRVYTPGNLTATPNYLSFSFQPGGYQPQNQAVSIVNSVGGAVPFNVGWSTTSGGAWLSASPSNGLTPSSLIVSAVPGTLAPGTYYGTITISPTTGGVAATQMPVTLTVFNTSQLIVDPTSLIFNCQPGVSQPSKYISVQSTGSPISFNAGVQGPSWITVAAGLATTPTGIGVNANPPAGTPPGTYTASVVISPTNGGGSVVSVPVSATVASSNYLTLGRTSVSIDYSTGGANPAPEFVPVTSSGDPLRFDAVASTLGSNSWLLVSQSSQYTPAHLTISVNPTNLAPGTYSGSVLVTSDFASNTKQSIPVTLTVTNSVTFVASPFGLVFSYQAGGTTPATQLLSVSSGSTNVNFTASAVTNNGGNWLLITGGGTTPAALAAAVSPTGLNVGTYTGSVLIKSNDGSVPDMEIPVIFNVSAAPVFQPSTGQLSFQFETSGSVPPSQTVTIGSTSTDATIFYTTALTADGGTWLSASPSLAATPGNLSVSVDPTGLAPGLYYGVIVVTDIAGNSPATYVPVSFQVSNGPLLTVNAQPIFLSALAGIGGNVTQTISVGSAGPPVQFTVTTSGGLWLSANPTQSFTGTTINVVASANKLNPGFYLGLVTMQIQGVAGTQQSVPVLFMVNF